MIRQLGSRGRLYSRCFASSAILRGGRTAPYRRLNVQDDLRYNLLPQALSRHLGILSVAPQLPASKIFLLRSTFSTTPRTNAISFRDLKSGDKQRDSPRPKTTNDPPETDAAEEVFQQSQRENRAESSQNERKQSEGSGEDTFGGNDRKRGPNQEGGKEQKQKERQKREEPPPPPPHGNKTPWQVFTETLKTEFQANQEWKESTKALSSSAHQFTENESIKRARAAYSAASGAATSSTATALKGTGKVLGQTAAWTWDSPVVKGVRTGVNATGRGLEAATRPVRETNVYKSVKDVIDDGSSSRYGGWVEKEERQKQRELRELNEFAQSGKPGRRAEKVEEDPK